MSDRPAAFARMSASPGTPDREVVEMVRAFLVVQARTARDENRALRRSVHAKGVCAKAVFEVPDLRSVNPRLAFGMFARPGRYAATVRFSNSQSNLNRDLLPDVRGMAFTVHLPGGSSPQRQDFSMQSAATLPFAGDLHALGVFTQVFAAANREQALAALPYKDQLAFSRMMVAVWEQARTAPSRPYQALRYWSAAPFSFGPQDVVKYSAWPVGLPAIGEPLHDDPDALADALQRHLQADEAPAAFDFGVQFLDADAMTYQGGVRSREFWIENLAAEWPESQAPFHVVARLRLQPRSPVAPEVCEALRINVARNRFADFAPVGSIQRIRDEAVSASQAARLGASERTP